MPLYAPRCAACGGLAVRLVEGRCPGCRQAQKAGKPHKRPYTLHCECGRKAVEMIVVTIGPPDDPRRALLPLCARCLQCELEMEADA